MRRGEVLGLCVAIMTMALVPGYSPLAQETGWISGTVTSIETGDPVGDVYVGVFVRMVEPPDSNFFSTGVYTNEFGEYILCDVPETDEAWVKAHYHQYYPYPDSVQVVAGDTTEGIDFQVHSQGDGYIEGRVVHFEYPESLLIPIEGATVYAYFPGDPTVPVDSAISDLSGDYSMALAPDDYIFYCEAEGYESEWWSNKHSPYEANILHVELLETYYINYNLDYPDSIHTASGVVRDEGGNPVPGAQVSAMVAVSSSEHKDYSFAWVATALADHYGHYTLSLTDLGTHYILAVGPENAPTFLGETQNWLEAQTLEGTGQHENVDINLFGTEDYVLGSISGSVSSEGEPLRGVRIYALREGDVAAFSITDDEGHYTITGLIPGESYQVQANKVDYENAFYPGFVTLGEPPSPEVTGIDFELELQVGISEDRADDQRCLGFYLNQNTPNPFNPETQIHYRLLTPGLVKLTIYNIRGQKVVTLVDENQQAGHRSVHWDGSSFSSGIYFYRLQAGDFVETRKMILLR